MALLDSLINPTKIVTAAITQRTLRTCRAQKVGCVDQGKMSRPKKLPSGLEFNGWRFTTTKGPIANGEQLEKYVRRRSQPLLPWWFFGVDFFLPPFLLSCRFEAGLKLPVLPEEVYSANTMVFEHIKSGERIEVRLDFIFICLRSCLEKRFDSTSRNVSVARMLLKVAFYLIAMRQSRFSNSLTHTTP